MNKAAGRSPYRRDDENTEVSGAFRWAVVQQADTGCHILIGCGDHVFLFTAHPHKHRPLSPKTLLTSLLVSLHVWHGFFILNFSFCRNVKRHQHTHSLVINPAEDPLLCKWAHLDEGVFTVGLDLCVPTHIPAVDSSEFSACLKAACVIVTFVSPQIQTTDSCCHPLRFNLLNLWITF